MAMIFLLSSAIFIFLRKTSKSIKTIALVTLLFFNAIIFISIAIYNIADSQLFYPHFDTKSYNELKYKPNAEELTIKTDTDTISGFLLHLSKKEKAPLVIYFYGNGENAARRFKKLIKNNTNGI